MSDLDRVWIAFVTFERRNKPQDVLPDWAHGGCGRLIALAASESEAAEQLTSDIEGQGLKVVGIEGLKVVREVDEIERFDEHLGANFLNPESGKKTVWGTIHCYKGEGET